MESEKCKRSELAYDAMEHLSHISQICIAGQYRRGLGMRSIPSMADGQGCALGSGSIPDAAACKNYNQLSCDNLSSTDEYLSWDRRFSFVEFCGRMEEN